MSKVILIYSNCVNPTAKGDFAFGASIAHDLSLEIQSLGEELEVILCSTKDGIGRFESMYKTVTPGFLEVDDQKIGLCALEDFDSINNKVVAFIEANLCKHPPGEILKRVLSPTSKFLFIGAPHQPSFSQLLSKHIYLATRKKKELNVYEFFDHQDTFLGSAGLGSSRLGLPLIKKQSELLPIDKSIDEVLQNPYGFMYASNMDPINDAMMIAQYLKITNFKQYLLVGDFEEKDSTVELAFDFEKIIKTREKFPSIQFFKSLPNAVMRDRISKSAGSLVLSTGVMSTLEVLQDEKLPFYQFSEHNERFAASYLKSVKSICSSSSDWIVHPSVLIEFSKLLFAPKPLKPSELLRTKELVSIEPVCNQLIKTNKVIMRQASGTLATRLLNFIKGERKTKKEDQIIQVCESLRKPGETINPQPEQALRRAAAWGRLLELKILVRILPKESLNCKDKSLKLTPLHWAVRGRHIDCIKYLLKSQVALDVQDTHGKTPLHLAVMAGDKIITQLLIDANASLDHLDKEGKSARDYANDELSTLFPEKKKSECCLM